MQSTEQTKPLPKKPTTLPPIDVNVKDRPRSEPGREITPEPHWSFVIDAATD
jgi:hypothetical protein